MASKLVRYNVLMSQASHRMVQREAAKLGDSFSRWMREAADLRIAHEREQRKKKRGK